MIEPTRSRRPSSLSRRIATAAALAVLACGTAAFVVFPFRRGFDLVVPLASLAIGTVLLAVAWRWKAGRLRSWTLGALLVITPGLLFYGLLLTLHEVGEIVVLRTTDAEGTRHDTRVAVLDHQGSAWVGADGGRKRWMQRLQSNPRIEVIRGEAVRCYVAVVVDDPVLREEVFRGIEEKYLVGRIAGALGHRLFPRGQDAPARPSSWVGERTVGGGDPEGAAAAIRLDPCEPG